MKPTGNALLPSAGSSENNEITVDGNFQLICCCTLLGVYM